MEKVKGNPSRYFVWALFFGVLCVHLLLALIWQRQFFVYFFVNTATFMEAVSWACWDIVHSHKGFPIFYAFTRVGLGGYWPPLVPMIGLWTLLLLPAPWFFLPNFFYLAMIMLGIYFSTRILIGDNFYSMLAAVIFSCYWFVTIQLVAFELQLAATACIVWSFYWYLRSCFFTRFWSSLLVGLFMVLALYCDRLTPGFFIFSLFLVPGNFRNKRSWLLMVLVLALVTICVWPFYGAWKDKVFGNSKLISTVFSYGRKDAAFPLEAFRTVWHNPQFLWAHLSYYFISVPERLLGYGFTALLLSGMFFVHRLRKPYPQVLWTALGIPLALFIAIIKKDQVYIFPLCIYFAMITSIGIYFIRSRFIRWVLIILMITLSVMQSILFNSYRVEKPYNSLFSHQFTRLEAQGIPRLFLQNYPWPQNKTTEQVNSIVDQVGPVMKKRASLGERKQAMIVDLASHCVRYSAVFSLRKNLYNVKVINAEITEENFDHCNEDFLYLLSDKEPYAAESSPGSSGGCSWKSLEAVFRFPDSAITLYRVRR